MSSGYIGVVVQERAVVADALKVSPPAPVALVLAFPMASSF
jgi:hypothetical protein